MNIENLYISSSEHCMKCSKELKKNFYFSRFCFDKLCNDCYKICLLQDSSTITCNCKECHIYYRKDFLNNLPQEEERHIIYNKYLKTKEDFKSLEEYNNYLYEVETLIETASLNMDYNLTSQLLSKEKNNRVIDKNKNKKKQELMVLSQLCNQTNPLLFYQTKEGYLDAEELSYCNLLKNKYLFSLSTASKVNEKAEMLKEIHDQRLVLPKPLNTDIRMMGLHKGDKNLEKKAGGYRYSILFNHYVNYAYNGFD